MPRPPLAPADFVDPVIEFYKKDVDRTLLRENLTLTVQQRFERFMAFMEFAAEMRNAGTLGRKSNSTLSRKLEESSVSSTVIATAVKMLESLPEPAQEEVVERLREYIAELQDEHAWDARFKRTQPQLIAAAQRVKDAIAHGQAKPLDLDQL